MDGRVVFDIQKEIQKGHSLDSYKLDNVSSHFMKGTIELLFYIPDQKLYGLKTKSLGNLKVNDYITFRLITKYGTLYHNNQQKYKIEKLHHTSKFIFIKEKLEITLTISAYR